MLFHSLGKCLLKRKGIPALYLSRFKIGIIVKIPGEEVPQMNFPTADPTSVSLLTVEPDWKPAES